MNLPDLSISELSRGLLRRAFSSRELTEACLERIGRLEPAVQAFASLEVERASGDARRADARLASGGAQDPLLGVPFGVKDVIETAAIATRANSRLLDKYVPDRNAAAVGRIDDAGGVLAGKLTTSEFAHGAPSFDLPCPPPRNPWSLLHTTGGSSSGSAAAVSAGMVTYALGTDTGGSVRIPAWLCGVVGLKPTYGRVSRKGVIPFSESLDQIGPLTRSTTDAAIVLEAIQERGGKPFRVKDIPSRIDGVRIGFLRHFSENDCDVSSELILAVDEALGTLAGLGADVKDTSLRHAMDYYAVRLLISECDAFAFHHGQFRRDSSVYGYNFVSRCLPACLFSAADYVGAQRLRRNYNLEIADRFRDFDILVTVGAGPAQLLARVPPDPARIWQSPDPAAAMCAPASLAGLPALAICCGFSKSGLPLGFQIMGRPWDEATVLAIGRAYETATGWSRCRPEIGRAEDTAQQQRTSVAASEMMLQSPPSVSVSEALLRAGIPQTALNHSLLSSAAPYVDSLARKLERSSSLKDESALVFGP